MAIVYKARDEATPIRGVVVSAPGPYGAFSAYLMRGRWSKGTPPLSVKDFARLYENVSSELVGAVLITGAVYALWPDEVEARFKKEAEELEAHLAGNPDFGSS